MLRCSAFLAQRRGICNLGLMLHDIIILCCMFAGGLAKKCQLFCWFSLQISSVSCDCCLALEFTPKSVSQLNKLWALRVFQSKYMLNNCCAPAKSASLHSLPLKQWEHTHWFLLVQLTSWLEGFCLKILSRKPLGERPWRHDLPSLPPIISRPYKI